MTKLSNRIKSFLDNTLILFWIISGGGVLFVLARIPATAMLFLYTLLLIIVYRPKIKNLLINAYVYVILFVVLCMWVCYLFAVQPQDLNKYAYTLIVFILSGFLCIYFFSKQTNMPLIYLEKQFTEPRVCFGNRGFYSFI